LGEWIVLQIMFVIIAGLGLAAALATVLARNLVHAALFLVAFFFTIACQFVLLEAEFLAALQVLVYIGAVAIILMFGIMLTRNVQGDDPSSRPSAWQVPGLIVGLGMFVVLGYGISFQQGVTGRGTWALMDERPSIRGVNGGPPPPRAEPINNMAKVVGDELLTRYVIAFEVAGLLLTAALVGAIALAHRDEHEPGSSSAGHRAAVESAEPAPLDGPVSAAPASPAMAGRGL
jgi:NADH:ubiquinone oxidoreductase subunit 6 (subunit J)